MLFQNIKQAIRGMLKDKTFTLMNITGFAVGFAVCIIIMIFAYKEYTTDRCYPNSENIYRLVDKKTKSSGIDSEIAQKLKDFSDVQQAVSVFYADFNGEGSHEFLLDMETGNSIETKKPYIVTTSDFFPFFGIKTLVSKAEKPFANTKSIVLTRSVAMRLYGKIDVLDKIIKKEDAYFTISAVVEDMPKNSSFCGDFFVHIDHPDYEIAISYAKGVRFRPHDIYIQINKDADVTKFTTDLNANFPKNKSLTESVQLQPIRNIYLDTYVESNYNKTGSKLLIWVFITIAVLTLIMSIFNYANFMISRQMATLKNSGIRIANGALRSQIRAYYFTEVTLAVLVAFGLALIIAQLVMPYAEQLLDTPLGLHWLLEPKLSAIFMIILIGVIIVSAIAPLGFISRMKIQALFGKTNIKSHNHPIKKVMNIVQLTISIVLLVAVFVVNKQLNYVKTKDVGFKTSHLLRLNIPYGFKNYNMAKAEYSKLPFVEHLALTSHTPGSGWWRMDIQNKEGKDVKFQVMQVDEDFLKTFGMQLKKGRAFRKTEKNKNLYYISENGYKILGWNNLEDIKIRKKGKVTGVVNDLFYNSLHSKMMPAVFLYTDVFYSGLNLKLTAGNLSEQMKAIEKTWKEIFGCEPFSFNFYDQYFDSLYKKEERQAKALTLFVIIAFIITCMGLLSQVLQNTQNRIKEIGIRKINGASLKQIMFLLNREFMGSVVIAFLIATPIAYYTMNRWLENFAYKTELSWWIFILAGISALLIALLTVSWQSWRTATRNPVEALRYE